jgi:hypothetical protein
MIFSVFLASFATASTAIPFDIDHFATEPATDAVHNQFVPDLFHSQ